MQIPIDPQSVTGSPAAGGVTEIAPGVAYLRTGIVNVVFLGADHHWVMIDVGIPGYAKSIRQAVAARFGPRSRPRAILLTHGHFDHVGELKTLAKEWDTPIQAHPDEMSFLDGRSSYPKPRPRLTDGLMSLSSPLFPRGPIDVSDRLAPLPADGRFPFLPGWRWIHTPGHSPGHVSFWHEAARILVAGDAVVTTAQEQALSVLRQKPEMHGPPRYFTPDWAAAEASVHRLAELKPDILVTGHGPALAGPRMTEALDRLARAFRTDAVPA